MLKDTLEEIEEDYIYNKKYPNLPHWVKEDNRLFTFFKKIGALDLHRQNTACCQYKRKFDGSALPVIKRRNLNQVDFTTSY